MAEGSRVAIRLIEELEWGVTPDAQFSDLNWSEESLNIKREKERKKTILQTREKPGLVAKTQSADGDIKTILQAGNVSSLLEGAFGAAWIDVVGGTGGGSITAGASGSNLEITFATESVAGDGGTITFGSGITIDILKDQVIFIHNAPDSANNGAFIVKDVVGQVVQVNSPLADAVYEDTAVVAGDRLRNGDTLKSYSIERAHLDINVFFLYAGMVVETLEFGFAPEEELNADFTFMGKGGITSTSTSSNPAASTAVDNPDFVTGKNVQGVYIDYDALANCKVEEMSIKIDNGAEGRKSVAVFGPCAVRIKPIDVTGSIVLFFEDLSYYNQYINDDYFQLTYIIADSLGNIFAFTLARVEFSDATTNTSDAEDQVPEEYEFSASPNGVFTVQICKYEV